MSTTMIRNNMAGPTVFTDEKVGHVEWLGAGDPNGLDIQPVPPEMVDNVQFRQAITRGILSVESADEAIEQALTKHKHEWETRQDRARNAGKDAVAEEPSARAGTLVVACLGPAGKTGEPCPNPVAVRASSQGEAPALCASHGYLKSQFVPSESGKIIEGKPEIVWTRLALGARERG